MQPVEVPRVFSDRYELTHLIARGGMAEVYRARDRLLDRPVALKVLFPELSVDRAFVERFRREAQAAAKLSHPNIVPVFDWGEDASSYFIVMEYIDGRPLSAVLRETGPLEPKRAAEITAQVAAALASAHRHGVVHRDIKPGNVLITNDGQVKVTDFGIARAVNTEESLTQTGAVMGTATYFSPEQAEGIGVDARTDIYSLGVVLFEMLTGRPPFLGDTPVSVASKHVRDIAPMPRELLETVPVEIEAVTMKAMAKDPDLRYQNAEDFRADLLRYLEGLPVEAGPPVGSAEATGVIGATQAMGASPRTQSFPEPLLARATAGRGDDDGDGSLLLVLLAAVAVVAYLLVDTFAGGFPLPNVVGKPVAQAEQVLTAKNLVIGAISRAANPAPTGTVVSTDPVPGTNVAKHAVVNLTVSAGEATVKVPSVVTDDLTTAEAVLSSNGLNYKVKFVTSNGQQNFVLSQNPVAGASVRRGATVTLSIPKPTNQVPVPNLTGLTAQQAAAQLAPSLSVGSQTQACSNSFPSGQVSGSSPPAGTSVGRGSSVNLVISSGPCQVVVKNVVGQAANDATGVLQGQGLTVTVASTTTCDPSDNGNVVSQDPTAGTQVSLPATDTITVCSVTVNTTTTTPPGP